MLIPLLLSMADVTSASDPASEIVVTASRVPEERDETAASVDIIDEQEITRLGEPLVYELLRLTPSASVSLSGPAGTLAQVRIRGAEATHTLLFVDGIKANDLSFGDEPRFELLNADLESRIEIVRGPQSALWGSQAIGGVVAVDGSAGDATGYKVLGEAGSHGFRRAAATGSLATADTHIAAALAWQHADGIDIFGGGDRDGYRNLSGRALASWTVSPDVTLGVNGFSLNGRADLDGNDPFTFARTHDLATRFGMVAGRIWGKFGSSESGLGGSLSTSLFRARNHNLFQDDEIGRATGVRRTLSGQAQYDFTTGTVRQQLIAAAEYENETFEARDRLFGGLADQDSHRRHVAITGEWKADIAAFAADVAVRRDFFSQFKDATALRASLLVRVGRGFSLAGSYSEGIAPPTFTELYGFFPGSFIGNPGLKPEKSRGFEASIRYDRNSLHAALTIYRQRLHDEIDTIFPSPFNSTVVNLDKASRRWGIEAEMGWQLSDALRFSASYAYLNATEPNDDGNQVRELRRPRHSGAITIDGTGPRLTYGASLAYVGTRTDQNFFVFPAPSVRLGSYWLADARVAYAIRPDVEIFARGSNLLDQNYQDVFGYRTEGRTMFVGLRLADRRSSP